MAGKVFDATLAKNGKRGNDFGQLLLSESESVAKKMFVNGAGLTFGTFQKMNIGDLIPGQYETNPDGSPKIDPKTGNPTLRTRGKLLQCTLLGTNQAKLAATGIEKSVSTDFNTTATKDNTAAIKDLTAAIEKILVLRAGGLSAGVHSVGGGRVFGGFGGGPTPGSRAAPLPRIPPVPGSGLPSPPIIGRKIRSGRGYRHRATSGAVIAEDYRVIDSGTGLPTMLPGYLGSGGSDGGYKPSAGADALPQGSMVNPNTLPSVAPYTFSGSKGSMAPGIAGPLFDPNSTNAQKAMSAIGSAGALYNGTMGVIGGIK